MRKIVDNHGLHRLSLPHLIKSINSLYNETFIVLDLGFKILEKITINQSVWQPCSLSQYPCNTYNDHIIKIWKNRIKTGINPGNIIFNNNLYLFEDSEDNLQ